MIVFKNFFRILKAHKAIILIYLGIFVVFTFILCGQNPTEQFTSFNAAKPSVAIINRDGSSPITDSFYKYMEKNTDLVELPDEEDKIADALFYEKANAVVYIYEGFAKDYANNAEKPLDVQYGVAASSEYATMVIERYLKVAGLANDDLTDSKEVIALIDQSLNQEVEVEVKSSLDVDSMAKMSTFFSFANYTVLSVCIFVVPTVMMAFNQKKIKDRNLISATKYGSITRSLYFGNLVFVLLVWMVLLALSVVILGDKMFSLHGLWYSINSLAFVICAMAVGFAIGCVIKTENAISALVNIIALGTSFMCGGFVPLEFLPDAVVAVAKVLPSYWYIHNNSLIASLEQFNWESLRPIVVGIAIVLGSGVLYVALASVAGKKIKTKN